MLRPTLLTICLLLLSTLVIASEDGQPSEAALRYIEEYKTIAVREMQRSGIPASIKMAQSIHESSWGKGSLALNSNNFFGIKCKEEWTGEKFYKEDDDYRDGELIKSCFRVYDSIEASFEDHSNFLMNNLRYESLFRLEPTDYVGWAKGLKACGYATDKKYAEKLIRTIEEYELYKLDLPEVNMANLIVQPNLDALVQDTVDPYAPDNNPTAEEHYDVPPAFRLPDDYVRNSYATPASPPIMDSQAAITPAPNSEVHNTEPNFDESYNYDPAPPVVHNSTTPIRENDTTYETDLTTEEYYTQTEPEPTFSYESTPTEVPQYESPQVQTPEYQTVPQPQATPEPAPAIVPQEQTTARQAPAAAAAPKYSINPQLRARANKSNKRKNQTLQKSRSPQLSSSYRRR